MAGSVRVRRAACKDEALVAIAAIDIAALVDFEPDSRVAKGSSPRDVAGTVAGDPARFDGYGFRIVDHGRGISNRRGAAQPDQK